MLRFSVLSHDINWMQKHTDNSYIICFKQSSRCDSPCFYLFILASNRDAKLCNLGRNLENKKLSCQWLKLNKWPSSSPCIVRKQKLGLWEGNSDLLLWMDMVWHWMTFRAGITALSMWTLLWAKEFPVSTSFSLAPCVKFVGLALAGVPSGINKCKTLL